ncbi:MAG TPA: FG-GAP-like repeat-containing protein [Bacteroidales bacterium]|nr:FG-GAP-like repeat-containing protein [Bacteroidales bacterium]
MKKFVYLSVILLLIFTGGCRNRKVSEQGSQEDLMSVRTLGLAYLEEFKLDEAEKEFLKFIELAPEDKFGYANLGLTYLRMGNYPEAKKQLTKAISIDSLDADVRLILSTVYKMNDEQEKAIAELKKALSFAPGHVKILYELSELYSGRDDAEALNARKAYLVKLIQNAPGNLVPVLNLTEILLKTGDTDGALEQLELIRKEFPEFPREALPYYDKAVLALRKNDRDAATLNFTIFHNYLKVSPPYQAGMLDLKGPGGSLIGFPVVTFDRQNLSSTQQNETDIDAIKFTPVPEAAGLGIIKQAATNEFGDYSHTEAADYDGDGDVDLYVSSYDGETSSFRRWLFNNNSGMFTDVAADAGLTHSGRETSAIFGDYDNDGFLDLYVLREEGDILYKNDGNGKFTDVTDRTIKASKTGGNMALFFDADHDGDLDLFEARSNINLLYRNNADGTFTEQAEQMNLAGKSGISTDAAFGDFDEDGDIDLIVVNENESNEYFSNQRQGIFSDFTYEGGLESRGGSGRISVSDYNNDGFLDLFITSVSGDHRFYRNPGNGRFVQDRISEYIDRTLRGVMIHDAAFLDFDNDGHSDLFIAGESKGNGRGLFLFHNNGKGEFEDVSRLLPEEITSGRKIALFDYNEDGDVDIAIARSEGGLTLLRNDGGNNNHFVKIKLVGLRAGSAKNNHFGIGAKVEIRAGDLYQTTVVTDPDLMFGIGQRSMADVIRITWTNGVPQNIFYPAADQALIEAQTLKGSCPFLYAWNGENYEFVKDIMWRSGLGMPLGIMGGNTAYAFADASDDYLKIPGESMKEENGKYTIQVTSELWETIYTDRLGLVAVDHPDSTEIFVPEQFSPPPFPGMKIYNIGKKIPPVSATDSYGNNILTFIKTEDDIYHSGFQVDKYQGITEMKEIILDPGRAGKSGSLFLFMNGWIFPTDASINVALSQSENIKVVPPQIQVMNESGKWETVVGNAGFPMGKDKTVIIDLSGKFLSKDHRIKIITNMEIYWDQIFFADRLSGSPVSTKEINPVAADIHYRGFSNQFRKGGRFGPHWFDYSQVSAEPKWRDLSGNYTRYGDVLPLITASDNKYIISNAGDEITVSFDASSLPKLRKGWKRDFLINSVGWVKDGDINTAHGNTVLPLPFHGMKSYPPSPEDVYPSDPGLIRYNREYNTRVVTGEGYINALKVQK